MVFPSRFPGDPLQKPPAERDVGGVLQDGRWDCLYPTRYVSVVYNYSRVSVPAPWSKIPGKGARQGLLSLEILSQFRVNVQDICRLGSLVGQGRALGTSGEGSVYHPELMEFQKSLGGKGH